MVWTLAWPVVALNSLQVVNTLLDRFWIGHLPLPALTAHSASMNVMFLMFSLAVALATGGTAVISRAYGAGDVAEYRKAAQESLALSVGAGLLTALITYAIAGPMSSFILPSQDQAAVKEMVVFVQVYACGLPAIFFIQVLAGALRGIGDTRSPMYISGLQIGLHVILNSILIPRMGLPGAATALSASASISAIIYLRYMARTPLGPLRVLMLPNADWAIRILRIALPAAAMAALRVFSLTAFTLVLKRISGGSEAIAAMGLSMAIESIMFMPAFGLSAAAGALVGQSLGMGNPKRAERLAWIAGHHGALVTIALVTPIYIGAPALANLLAGDKAAVIHETVVLLRYLCITEFLFSYAMVMLGALQGAGDTVRPLWISVLSLWGLRVPLAIFLAWLAGTPWMPGIVQSVGFGLGSQGAWLAMTISQGVQGVLAILAFMQGRWKTQKV